LPKAQQRLGRRLALDLGRATDAVQEDVLLRARGFLPQDHLEGLAEADAAAGHRDCGDRDQPVAGEVQARRLDVHHDEAAVGEVVRGCRWHRQPAPGFEAARGSGVQRRRAAAEESGEQ